MKQLITAITIATLGTLAFTSFASPHGGGQHGHYMEQRLERMAKHLDMTTAQQQQIRTMFESHMKVREAMRGKMQQDVRSVLTDEQRVRFDRIRAERMAQHSGTQNKHRCEHHR